jgi:hypothetical protein
MNLKEISPLIVKSIQTALSEKVYPFGVGRNAGVGNKIASGNLRNSVQASVKKGTEGVDVIEITMAEYGQWVQSGRLPGKKKVPISVIEKWIKERKLKGRNQKTGRYITDKSFAFAIQTNIYKFGIKPSNFLDVSIENMMNNNEIIDLLEDASFEDLINAIEGI